MIAIMPEFTDQQRKAIDARDTSVSVSAGAGCGKTFVLTERFLAHLEPNDPAAPPAQLHELIAITFTDRAAREMRDRIQQKCYERLQQAEGAAADYWLRLMRSLDTARISTIHSFCGALLRANAVEARLDPRFTVIEQTQADTLAAELIDDVLREKLSEQDESLIKLTVQFGLDRLRSMIAALLASGRTINFGAWLKRDATEVVEIWDRYRREVVLPRVLQDVVEAPATQQLLKDICHLKDASGVLRGRCDVLSRIVPTLPHSKHPQRDLNDIFENARIQGAGKREKWPDGALYDRFKESAEDVRAQIKWANGFLEFDTGAALAEAAAGLELLKLVKVVHERYEARKTELAWLDFNDLLNRARELLTDPAHAELQRRLSSQVRLLLVDECQDTDPVQVELIRSLCGELVQKGRLFFVGDYKQSIYRFRGADPRVFRDLQQNTPQVGQLPLSINFRSQPAILDFVNALFHDVLLGGDEAALAYEPLRPSRPQVSAVPAVEFLWPKLDGIDKRAVGGVSEARKREADWIARRIRRMLDRGEALVAEEVAGKWSSRAVEQKDIAILFRALSEVQHYEDALRRYGINYYLVGGHAFYAQQEIYDVVNLLRALASPADQVSLAGVLRSPMFSLDDETLFWLGQHPQGLAAGMFGDRWPTELTATQRERAQFAATTIEHLRQNKDRVPIASLLNETLALTGYDATLLGEFLGERKLANLRKLIEQARTFDRSGVLGLADFIVQLAEFVAQQPREPLAATHPEGADVVRLMTIHQAKGLEFPVVFVPDINRAKKEDDESAVWDVQLGPLAKPSTRSADGKRISGFDLYRAMSATEAEAERLRLLYVATTRAKDYLVLSGGVFDFDDPTAPWTKLLAEHFDLQAGKYLRPLPKGWQAPAIKVTGEAPQTDSPKTLASRCDLEQEANRALALAKEPAETGTADRLAGTVAADGAARRRFSVSRLSGELRPADDAPTATLDDEEPILTSSQAADVGTLVHRALARVEFGHPVDVAALVRRLIEARFGAADEHQSDTEELVSAFLRSPRAKSLSQARSVHRELEFVLAWPPETGNGVNNVARYLQGYIDCLYQDTDGNWHLLDYKTNRVSAENLAAAAGQYEMQLGVYALAVEQILGKPPVELVVHFLKPVAEYRFVWDDAMRRRTVQQVNQAMAAIVNGEGKMQKTEDSSNPQAVHRATTHP